jgi:hypothetical protein
MKHPATIGTYKGQIGQFRFLIPIETADRLPLMRLDVAVPQASVNQSEVETANIAGDVSCGKKALSLSPLRKAPVPFERTMKFE